MKSGSALGGFEYQATPAVQLYTYYGGVYAVRNSALDSAGKLSGYGFTGSGGGANRSIQQATIGMVRAVWRDPQKGAFLINWQYAYLSRSPWYVAPAQPANAHANLIYLNLRYVLP